MGDYGRFGWGRLGSDVWLDPIGLPGLLRFGPKGRVDYSYEPPEGLRVMVDCYALNVSGETAWAVYHPSFSFVRVDQSGRAAGWSSRLGPIDVIATDGRFVLGCAGWSPARARLGRFTAGEVELLTEVELRMPSGRPGSLVGRGGALHLFSPDGWYRLELASVLGQHRS
jgi:hypothetical protein